MNGRNTPRVRQGNVYVDPYGTHWWMMCWARGTDKCCVLRAINGHPVQSRIVCRRVKWITLAQQRWYTLVGTNIQFKRGTT